LPDRRRRIEVGEFDVDAAIWPEQRGPQPGLQKRGLARARFAAQHAEAEIAVGDGLAAFGQFGVALKLFENLAVSEVEGQQAFDRAAFGERARLPLGRTGANTDDERKEEDGADDQPEIEFVPVGKPGFGNESKDGFEVRIEGEEEQDVEQQEASDPIFAVPDFGDQINEACQLFDLFF